MTKYVDPYVDHTNSRRLDDGRWEHTFSQSFINTFMHCPEQARAAYFRELPREETDSTALGKAVHAGIEYALIDKIQEGSIDLLMAQDVAVNELETIGQWQYTKLSRDKVFQLAPMLVSVWAQTIAPAVDPMFVEKSFNLELYSGKHRVIRLGGTMDCVDTAWEPWDWKTASREYEKWEYQRWAVQPTVYTWATHQLLNDTATASGFPDELRYEVDESLFHYGIVLHGGGTQRFSVWRDQSHIEWLKQICSQIAYMIEHNPKGPWPLNDHGWHCSPKWCGKWDSCKGLLMPDNWQSYA